MIEEFWNRIYEGYSVENMDGLQVLSWVLNDYLRLSTST
jgi:hypothetical protein